MEIKKNFINYSSNFSNKLDEYNDTLSIFLKSNLTTLQKQKSKYIFSNSSDETNRLTSEEKNEIILTRLISSGISILFCVICIILFFIICIKNKILQKRKLKEKEEYNIDNITQEIIDDINFDDSSKKQRFLSIENEIDNNNSASELNDTKVISYGNSLIRTYTEESEKNIFDQYNQKNKVSIIEQNIIETYNHHDSQIKNKEEINNSNFEIKIIIPHQLECDYYHETDNNNDFISNNSEKKENSKPNNSINEFKHDITSESDRNSRNSNKIILEKYSMKSETKNEVKMGLINTILIILIFTNLGHSACSFLVPTSDLLERIDTRNFIPLTENNNDVKYSANCISQGLFQNFFELSSICLTTVIALLMRNSQKYINVEKLTNKYKWFVIHSFFFPLGFSFGIGPSGPWCWVNHNEPDGNYPLNIMWTVFDYGFGWFNILIICYKFSKLIIYFRSRSQEIKNKNRIEESRYIKKSLYIMYAFPLILIISKIPGLMNRIKIFVTDKENPIFYHFHASFSVLVGFFNSIIFIYIHKKYL